MAPRGRETGRAEPHRFVSEPGANLIHCVLDPSRPIEFSVEHGQLVGREIFDESVRPDRDQPKPVMPSASPASRAAAVRNKASSSWVASASRRERVRERKSAVLSFKVIVRPAREACFKRAETRSHKGHRAYARVAASAVSSGRVTLPRSSAPEHLR
jgi:hypothetical protein